MITLRSACVVPARRSPGASRAAATLAVSLFLFPCLAHARPGIHPVVVSSWDTRASSVSLEYRHGFMKNGGFNDVGYVAAFSSTSGKLSAQFGLHYVNLAELAEDTVHGLSGTATAVFNLPVTARYENGLPKAALGLYVGSAPTIMTSGARNYLSIPFLLGVGVPLTPVKVITITPWAELSPGVNLDTRINSFEFSDDEAQDLVGPDGDVRLTEEQVEAIVSDSVELDVSATGGLRGGIDFALHVSNAVDFAANVTLSSLGSALAGPTVTYVGGGVVWRWDDIVPAVLPADKRLLHENCDDVEARFRTCPNSRRWQPPPESAPAPPAAAPLPPPAPAVAAPPPPAAPPAAAAPAPPPPAAPPPAAPPPAAPPPAAPPPAAPAPAPPTDPATKAFPQ
jgi:hypothetical protein